MWLRYWFFGLTPEIRIVLDDYYFRNLLFEFNPLCLLIRRLILTHITIYHIFQWEWRSDLWDDGIVAKIDFIHLSQLTKKGMRKTTFPLEDFRETPLLKFLLATSLFWMMRDVEHYTRVMCYTDFLRHWQHIIRCQKWWCCYELALNQHSWWLNCHS